MTARMTAPTGVAQVSLVALPAHRPKAGRLVVVDDVDVDVVDVCEGIVVVTSELVAAGNLLLLTHILCIELVGLVLRRLQVGQLAHELWTHNPVGNNSLVTNSTDLGLKEKFGSWMAHAWPGVSGWQGGMQHIGLSFRGPSDTLNVSSILI